MIFIFFLIFNVFCFSLAVAAGYRGGLGAAAPGHGHPLAAAGLPCAAAGVRGHGWQWGQTGGSGVRPFSGSLSTAHHGLLPAARQRR